MWIRSFVFCFSIESFSVCQELPNISQAQLVYQVALSHTQPKGVITFFLPHLSSLTPSPHGEEEGTLSSNLLLTRHKISWTTCKGFITRVSKISRRTQGTYGLKDLCTGLRIYVSLKKSWWVVWHPDSLSCVQILSTHTLRVRLKLKIKLTEKHWSKQVSSGYFKFLL